MSNKSYDKSFAELQKILEELQGDEVSIDKLSVKIKKATALLATCKGRLREVESELSSLDEEE